MKNARGHCHLRAGIWPEHVPPHRAKPQEGSRHSQGQAEQVSTAMASEAPSAGSAGTWIGRVQDCRPRGDLTARALCLLGQEAKV